MEKKIASTQEMANKVVKNLPADYTYKMGYKNTLTVGEIIAVHDAREYYSGRGAKYNGGIKHGGYSYKMTLTELKKQYRQIVKEEKETANKRAAYAKKQALHLRSCKKESYVMDLVKEKISIAGNDNKEDARYWLNCYHGCGVYRLIIKEGKIVASIYGGLYNNRPEGVDAQMWVDCIVKYAKQLFGEGDLHIVKADGSGTYFYLRNEEDMELLKTKQYVVPAPNGDGNMGYSHLNTEII